MDVVIINDEPLLLNTLKSKLEQVKQINKIFTYTDPYDALNNIEHDNPEAVFLDVEIEPINGIDLAEVIKNKFPRMKIVFVTSCKDYAIQAFDLNAVDYLIRPVYEERLHETISRIRKGYAVEVEVERISKPSPKVQIEEHPKTVCFFNSMKFLNQYQEEVSVQWRTRKTQELFALLVHHRGKKLRKDVIVEQLWPNHKWQNGMSLLYNSIYYLRRTLKDIDFNIEIKNEENTYTLVMNDVQLDIQNWQNHIDSLPELTSETYLHHKKVIHMYKGDYLNEHSYHWSEIEKKHWRSIWLYHIRKVVDFLIKKEEFFEAINLYHYVQDIYPTGEESYFNLMKLYNKVNDKDAVETQYHMLKKILENEYQVEPNKQIQEWFKNWQADHKKIMSTY